MKLFSDTAISKDSIPCTHRDPSYSILSQAMGLKLMLVFLVVMVSAAFIHKASCFTEEELETKHKLCNPDVFHCLLSYCCNYKEACTSAITSTSNAFNVVPLPSIAGTLAMISMSFYTE